MRTIKFRQYYIGNDDSDPAWNYFDLRQGHAVIDGEWQDPQEFTGLLDKHGKEIYEGDILDAKFVGDTRIVGTVKWSDKNACWGIKDGDYYELLNGIEDIKVIGNIYENPNLLASPTPDSEREK